MTVLSRSMPAVMIHAVPTRTVSLVGVPTRYGTAYPGCERTPHLLRTQGVVARLAHRLALADPPVRLVQEATIPLPDEPWTGTGFPLRSLPQVRTVARRQAEAIGHVLEQGAAPLIVGGDCTTMLGTALALQRADRSFGLVCFDAHGDFNTEQTTPSGNIHGMTVSALTGRGHPSLLSLFDRLPVVPEHRVALVGVRDLDPPEAVALASSAVTLLDPAALRGFGAGKTGNRALEVALSPIHGEAPDGLLLHVDLDVLDPSETRGMGLPIPGGLSLRDLLDALQPLLASRRLLAIELTEAAPALEPSGRAMHLVEALLERFATALGPHHA